MSHRNRYATLPRYRVTITVGKAKRELVVRAANQDDAVYVARDKFLLRYKQSIPSGATIEAVRQRS